MDIKEKISTFVEDMSDADFRRLSVITKTMAWKHVLTGETGKCVDEVATKLRRLRIIPAELLETTISVRLMVAFVSQRILNENKPN